ncbi:methionine ABC transporter ATP-binding protein [Liberibacter crescens]|nr:methionine ABC transporter ATP-binding protein [Liberibacter crescens]
MDDNLAVILSNVTKKFESKNYKFHALSSIDCSIHRHKITGIIGRSGAGKSTFIRLINKLEQPTTGKVIVNGVDLTTLNGSSLQKLRREVSMIFQHFNLLSSRTVYDNVALPLEISGYNKEKIYSRVMPLLELVGIADKRNHYPVELSGGQKQRVGIARALTTQPKILLSDEATSALDPETTYYILELLKKINSELGLTVLLITHEMDVIKDVTSFVLVLHDGKIVESGKTIDIISNPQHKVTKGLLNGLPIYKLPEKLISKFHDTPNSQSHQVIRVSFLGETSETPLISQLIKAIETDVNIISGAIDEIDGEAFGSLVISYHYHAQQAAQNFFEKHKLVTEALGYVN